MTHVQAANADINRDRILCMLGGSVFPLSNGVLENYSDPGAVWIGRIPVEDNEYEKKSPNIYPREGEFRVMHELYIGTVDEIVENFRQKLIVAFNTMPPTTEQAKVLERHGINKFTEVGFKASHADLQKREDRRSRLNGFKPRQSAWNRWELKRLVAQWHGRRFHEKGDMYLDHDGVKKAVPEATLTYTVPPTDNPELIQDLINALTILKQDREARDKKQQERMANGPTATEGNPQ